MESSGVLIPPPIYFALGLVAGVVLNHFVPLSSAPGALVPLGQILILAGLFLGAWGFSRLRAHRTTISLHRSTTAIVSDGPYGFSRNPLYVANVLIYAGIALWLRNVWAFVLLVPLIALIDRTVIPKEERYLERTFGETYLSYKRRVRRWL